MQFKRFSKPLFGLACLFASACTQQQAAEISFLGNQFYGRGGASSMESSLQASTSMQAAAPVMDVTSSDVSPMSISSQDLAPVNHSASYREAPPQQAYAPVVEPREEMRVAELPSRLPEPAPAVQAQPQPEQPILTVAENAPAPTPAAPPKEVVKQDGKTHRLQPGETLYRVSRTYAVSLDDLIAVNNIDDANAVRVGTELKLPNDSLMVANADQAAPPIVPVREVKPIELASADVKQVTLPKAATQQRPFIWPVEGEVISRFGPKSGGLYNDGMNISAPLGTPVHAVAPGEVVYAGNELKGYGNLVILKHADGHLSAYAHMQNIEVKKGQPVLQGDVIGQVGQSGHVEKPQLHFGLRKGKQAVDPMTVLKGAPKTSELAAL